MNEPSTTVRFAYADAFRAAVALAALLATMAALLLLPGQKALAQDADVVEANLDGETVDVDFGDVEVGDTTVKEVVVVNDTNLPITVGGFGLLGDDLDGVTDIRLIDEDGDVLGEAGEVLDLDGLLGNLLGTPIILGPGEEAVLQLTFAPNVSIDGDLSELDSALGIFDALGPLLGDTLNIINITGNPTPAGDDNPTISKIKPKKKQITDRTPKIAATVRDRETNLQKEDIKLFFDGKRVQNFTYNTQTDRLTYKPGRLAYKKHTVRIEATDEEGQDTAKRKSFRVVRR